MKTIVKHTLSITIAAIVFISCKKDIDHTVMTASTPPTVSLSPASVVLSSATSSDTVEAISWSASEYGFDAAVNYTVEIARAGANFVGAQSVNTGSNRTLKYVGAVLNDLAIGQGIAPGTTGTLDIRVKSLLSDSLYIYSSVSSLSVTTYVVEFPALLVLGGNSWVTPSTRTNGYLLASPDFDGKFEGYLNLPNADGWGGDAFKLLSTSSGIEYGWGTSSTTMAPGSSGNLWLTPAPNYMKVNADVNALTINYTPVNFFLSGDHNGWSTSATPMVYDPATKTVKATNVNFTAGNQFAFTANGGWDLNYKINGDGKLIYGGPPGWSGSNIPAPGTGVYTVILDLSAGNGSYTYTVE